MLPFLPTPYPDELLYSVCARFHQRSCNSTTKATVADLFGGRTVCAVVDLPCHLDYLSGQLPGTVNTPERLINENTLLPLYAPFLPRKRLSKLIAWMKGAHRGGSIRMSIGATASTVPVHRFMRYCPACLEEDAERRGETYWHRSHQVAGVRLCHKHNEWLVEDDSSEAVSAGKHDFRLAPNRHLPGHGNSLRQVRFIALHRMIAQFAAWLLYHPDVHRHGLEVLHRKYLHHLRRLDLASFTGRVDQKELVARFVAFYGEDFLRQVHCGIDRDSEENWLNSLARKPRNKARHPLRHFLLIHFLGLEPEEFFLEDVRARPSFGRGPWPCLNPASPHFGKFVVDSCEITRNSETGEPVGNFRCQCGFGYARTGPDKERSDRFRRGRILAFGSMWEEALMRMVLKERRSLRSTARALGVDVNTVKKHLARLTEGNAAPVVEQEDERKERRARWRSLQTENPEASRAELRGLRPADFTWLYRYDREWLYENLPLKKATSKSGKRRVDWARRDADIAAKILAAAREIQGAPGRPVRVTVCSIGRKLGVLALLQSKLDQLPATKVELERVVESRDVFNLRRVKLAVEVLKERGKPLRAWRIARVASIRPKFLADIEAELDRMMSMT